MSPSLKDWAKQIPKGTSLKEVEAQMILKSLEDFSQNRSRAAKSLGLSIRGLRNKLHQMRRDGLIVLEPAIRRGPRHPVYWRLAR